MEKKIVIVGAGYAGVLTAKKLAKRLKKTNQEYAITLIDKNPFHTMLTELHEVAAGRVEEDSIKISLRKVFAGRKVNVVLDKVIEIDYEAKTVKGEGAAYPYDYLVLAAGSKPTYYGVPGAEENSFKLWSYDDAVELKERIHKMFRMAACEKDPQVRKKLLTFYVVGAGFTGVEMIGELAEYVPILCQSYEVNPEEVTMVNVDGLSRPIPMLPERLSEKVERRLGKMGASLQMNAMVAGVGEDYIDLKINGQVERRTAGTVIWAAGIESADITAAAGEVLTKTRGNRIPVNGYVQSVTRPEVYVVGDNMFYIPEGEEKPVPQMVENCEQVAGVCAHNIIVDMTGEGEMEVYHPKFHGVMVCIGGRYGVAHVGLPGHFFSLASFFAMFAKHFINIIYFIQVLGWNKVFSYMKHEFFTIRHERSFLGGHFSNRTPSFLMVPLRIWLGAVWLYEGVMKVVEGWFQKPMLSAFFGGANSWYDSILNPSGSDGGSAATASVATLVASAADAASSASTTTEEAVETVGKVIFNWDIFGWIQFIFVSGTQLAESTLGDMAFKINIPILNWFVNHVILGSDGMQMFMQFAIVLMEILVGLALMGGLFTSVSAAASLVLQMMFVSTTGLYLNNIWMVFAGVAVLIGAGRTFGLDYYVMPRLKKLWKKLPIVRKSYLYHD